MTRVITTDRSFDDGQRAQLRSLAELMIPAEGALPSAADPVIFANIVDRLRGHAEVVREGLTRIGPNGADTEFSNLSVPEKLAVVDRLRVERLAFIALFEGAVAACYYRDDRVLRSLGLPARAPYPEGNRVEPTDWSLLSAVREREPFYRSV